MHVYTCIILLDVPATFLMTLANLEGEESFEVSMLGHAEEVIQERICDDELILVKGYVRIDHVGL